MYLIFPAAGQNVIVLTYESEPPQLPPLCATCWSNLKYPDSPYVTSIVPLLLSAKKKECCAVF